ncbi:MAG: BlaI/MecI/CopY family transcriptional regulator [Streptosporangiales bacterium]|nr:BlaI/MecI/CopY family transcriptional regulator [Streptosporangiales bacterium]
MPRFGDLEAAIMDRVWAAGVPVRVRDVVEDLQRERPIAFTTVQTVMENLFRKGWLRRAKEGRIHRYWPAASREEYSAGLVEEALQAAPDRAAVLARLVARMPRGELDALRTALEEAKEREGLS